MPGDLPNQPDPRGDDVIVRLAIEVRRDGSMSVSGDIQDLAYALIMLDSAKDSLRSYHDRRRVQGAGLIIPPHDVRLV